MAFLTELTITAKDNASKVLAGVTKQTGNLSRGVTDVERNFKRPVTYAAASLAREQIMSFAGEIPGASQVLGTLSMAIGRSTLAMGPLGIAIGVAVIAFKLIQGAIEKKKKSLEELTKSLKETSDSYLNLAKNTKLDAREKKEAVEVLKSTYEAEKLALVTKQNKLKVDGEAIRKITDETSMRQGSIENLKKEIDQKMKSIKTTKDLQEVNRLQNLLKKEETVAINEATSEYLQINNQIKNLTRTYEKNKDEVERGGESVKDTANKKADAEDALYQKIMEMRGSQEAADRERLRVELENLQTQGVAKEEIEIYAALKEAEITETAKQNTIKAEQEKAQAKIDGINTVVDLNTATGTALDAMMASSAFDAKKLVWDAVANEAKADAKKLAMKAIYYAATGNFALAAASAAGVAVALGVAAVAAGESKKIDEAKKADEERRRQEEQARKDKIAADKAAQEEAAEITNNQTKYEYEHGKISADQYIAYLKNKQSAFKAYTSEWMSIQSEIESAEKERADDISKQNKEKAREMKGMTVRAEEKQIYNYYTISIDAQPLDLRAVEPTWFRDFATYLLTFLKQQEIGRG